MTASPETSALVGGRSAGMESAMNLIPGRSPERARPFVAVTFGMLGDLRYLSHHDELRMLARALVRARWPVAFSQGFNPRPRIVMPLARPVGVSSDCELAIVALGPAPERVGDTPLSLLPELTDRLRGALPAGCPLAAVRPHPSRKAPQPQRLWYSLPLDTGDVAPVVSRIPALLAQPAVIVLRDAGPGRTPQPGDIRANLESLSVSGSTLEVELRFADQRTARPTEILEALQLPAETYAHRMHRRRVEWNMDVMGDQASPQLQTRDTLGYEESQS